MKQKVYFKYHLNTFFLNIFLKNILFFLFSLSTENDNDRRISLKFKVLLKDQHGSLSRRFRNNKVVLELIKMIKCLANKFLSI